MSFWSRLRQLFSNDRGFLRTSDGRNDLRWRVASLPLPIWVAPSADEYCEDIAAVVRNVNSTVCGSSGKPLLLLPEPIIADLYSKVYQTGAHPVRGIILVERRGQAPTYDKFTKGRGGVSHDTEDPEDGTCELLFDERSGELWCARILLPARRDRHLSRRHAVVLHEVGHALGLAHDDSPASIMSDTLHGRPGVLWTSDVRRLRAAYGR